EAPDGRPQGGQADGQAELVLDLLKGQVRGGVDGLADAWGVRGQAGLAVVAGRTRGDPAGLASALLEAADPGRANPVLVGHLLGGQARVAVQQDALAQVHRVRTHDTPPGTSGVLGISTKTRYRDPEKTLAGEVTSSLKGALLPKITHRLNPFVAKVG